MPRTSYQMVREFQEGLIQNNPENTVQQCAEKPLTKPDPEVLLLRLKLVLEEVGELVISLSGFTEKSHHGQVVMDYLMFIAKYLAMQGAGNEIDLVDVADAMCDSHVVISGTALALGIPEDEVYEVVHAANMRKLNGPVREDGKQLKPEGWVGPEAEIVEILRRAMEG